MGMSPGELSLALRIRQGLLVRRIVFDGSANSPACETGEANA